jgi:predicted membrane protein
MAERATMIGPTDHARGDRWAAARSWGRGLSLAAAGIASLLLLVYPYVLSGVPNWRVHAGLPIMMFGVAGLYIFGLGFEPRSRLVRGLFYPGLAWLLFTIGILTMVGG